MISNLIKIVHINLRIGLTSSRVLYCTNFLVLLQLYKSCQRSIQKPYQSSHTVMILLYWQHYIVYEYMLKLPNFSIYLAKHYWQTKLLITQFQNIPFRIIFFCFVIQSKMSYVQFSNKTSVLSGVHSKVYLPGNLS